VRSSTLAEGCPKHAAPPRSWRERALERLRRWAAPFPGAVAHHRPAGLAGLLFGHGRSFRRATLLLGEDASSYFRASGIAACAEQSGGLCSFRMGRRVALYQSSNIPLVTDDALAPSLDANKELFGDFMGSQPNDHPARRHKRLAVEQTLGSASFVAGIEQEARRHAREFLRVAARGPAMALDELALQLVAHVDSWIPGVLDLTSRPLTAFLASPDHGRVARAYFEIASEVISKDHRQAIADSEAIVPFVRALLLDNVEPIAAAPDTNLVKSYFALWSRAFTRAEIEQLAPAQLKELGTIIIAVYDTTYLSLLWAIAHVEADGRLKRDVVQAARRPIASDRLSLLDLVVLEAVRVGGSNPTALWRRVDRPFRLVHRGRETTIPSGTMLWLDRRLANRDPAVFPRASAFSPENIRAIVRSPRETLSSLLSRSRYEINSFSMVNTDRNPRKCPGRLFSVRLQALLLHELYSAYDVAVRGIDLRLQPHSSMPRPTAAGTIHLAPRASTGDAP
jgi:cytochrome P450